MTRDELAARLLERAYLEGDFLLRSGRRSRYYLDKYRFETDPQILAGLGRELAALVREHAPSAELMATQAAHLKRWEQPIKSSGFKAE